MDFGIVVIAVHVVAAHVVCCFVLLLAKIHICMDYKLIVINIVARPSLRYTRLVIALVVVLLVGVSSSCSCCCHFKCLLSARKTRPNCCNEQQHIHTLTHT